MEEGQGGSTNRKKIITHIFLPKISKDNPDPKFKVNKYYGLLFIRFLGVAYELITQQNDLVFKIILIGDSECGKSYLI
jgi:hypothetical protein